MKSLVNMLHSFLELSNRNINILVVLLLLRFSVFSKNNHENKVDSLLDKSYTEFAQIQFTESLRLADEALVISSSTQYSEGIVKSNLYIAKVLFEVGLNKDAFDYLIKNKDIPFFKNNILYQIETCRLKGRAFGALNLYNLAIQEFHKQLELSEQLTDNSNKNLLILWGYQNLGHVYIKLEKTDSIEKYLALQEKQLYKFDENDVFHDISILYTDKARKLIHDGDYESANDCLSKSIQLLNKYQSPYRYYTLERYGDMEAAKGNPERAIAYYREALENSLELKVTKESVSLYKLLTDFCVAHGLYPNEAKYYYHKYIALSDSLEDHNKEVIDIILNQNFIDNERLNAQNKSIVLRVLFIILLVSFIPALYFLLRYLISRHGLKAKNVILTKKEIEIDGLREKLEKNTFSKIIELAKGNSPEFLILFKKNHEKFVESLKALDPNIKSSELHFCALVYLNFSTKDIANYTFVTTRAVQIRKNRMRKKYNIPSDIDFNEWFRNLDN